MSSPADGESVNEVELLDIVELDSSVQENSEESEGEGEGEEEIDAFANRNFKDVLLGNHLPPTLLLVAIISFLIFFQTFLGLAGVYLDKYYTLLYSIPFLIIPIFWGWLVTRSREEFRNSASLQRTLQSLMLGYFADTFVYLLQWIAVYGLLILISYLYSVFGKTQIVLLSAAVFETIFEAIALEAIPEELLKYAILYHISTLQPLPSKYSAIVYVTFASLGFIFFSGTLRIVRVYWIGNVRKGIIYFAFESFLTSTMHVIAGLWIALNFLRQQFRAVDKSPIRPWRVVSPSIFLHAIFMSFISVLYLLYYYKFLDWKIFASVCAVAFLFLMTTLFITIRRLKLVLVDPHFYSLLTPEDEAAEYDEELEVA